MNEIDTYLREYNAHLFPLRKCVIGDPRSKQPLEANYQTKKYTYEKLAGYLAKGHGIGWRLGPRDLVLDLDVATAERPNKKGDQVRPLLENLLGSDQVTDLVVSPSGGRHYYLSLPDSVDPSTLRAKVRELPDVDVLRFRQHVVIAGSPHWQGGHYRWSDKTTDFGHKRAIANDTLLRLLRKDSKIDSPAVESSTIGPELLDTILEKLPVTDYRDHAEWFAVMAACHHCTGGDEAGLRSFLHWSLSDPDYATHGEQITKRWNSLNPEKSHGYTLGTLMHELRRFGAEATVNRVQINIEFGEAPPEVETPIDIFDPTAAPVKKTDPAPQKVRIRQIPDDYEVNKQIIAVLAAQPEIYARLDQLYLMEVQGSTFYFRRLDAVGITEISHRYCEFGDYKGKLSKWTPRSFPSKYGKQIERHENWEGVKRLRRICPMPVMTPRGIHQTIGYEPITGLFYFTPDADKIPRVPSRPSRQQAEIALAELVDLISEFPFADPSYRSGWLASLFGVVGRPLLGPCAPMTLIDGNRSGAGKGMLCDLISDICLAPGQHASKFSGLAKNEDEQRKIFLALARENPPIGIFDNFMSGGKIGSPVLDAILTTGVLSGRLLGLTQIVSAEFDSILFATANRVQLDPNSDLIRRIFYILLETSAEDPEQRVFKHPDIRAHAKENRGRYLAAALTVLEYARTHPDEMPRVSPWGSYKGYDLVRQSLVALGEPDPRDSIAKLKKKDDGTRNLRVVMQALEMIGATKNNPLTARGIGDRLETCSDFHDPKVCETLKEAKGLLISKYSTDPTQAIGSTLGRKYRDQALDGKWIRGVTNSSNSTQWFVAEVGTKNAESMDSRFE